MTLRTVDLVAAKDYPASGTIGTTPAALGQNVLAMQNAMQVYQRNTNNLDASFVRVDDLVKLGVAIRNGSRLTTVFPDLSGATTVAQLPQASAVGAGARRFVTDATATTFLSTVVGAARTQCR